MRHQGEGSSGFSSPPLFGEPLLNGFWVKRVRGLLGDRADDQLHRLGIDKRDCRRFDLDLLESSINEPRAMFQSCAPVDKRIGECAHSAKRQVTVVSHTRDSPRLARGTTPCRARQPRAPTLRQPQAVARRTAPAIRPRR